jgi:hypothetical protein
MFRMLQHSDDPMTARFLYTSSIPRLIRVSGPFFRWLLLVAVLGLCVVALASCTTPPYFHEWGSAKAGFTTSNGWDLPKGWVLMGRTCSALAGVASNCNEIICNHVIVNPPRRARSSGRDELPTRTS